MLLFCQSDLLFFHVLVAVAVAVVVCLRSLMPFPVRLSGSNINKAYCATLGYLRSAPAIHFPASPTRADEIFNLLLVLFPLLIKKGALNGTACTFILCQVLNQACYSLKRICCVYI